VLLGAVLGQVSRIELKLSHTSRPCRRIELLTNVVYAFTPCAHARLPRPIADRIFFQVRS
jgi:hypothetical protein